MKMSQILCFSMVLVVYMAGCGKKESSQSMKDLKGSIGEISDISKDGILAFLRDGKYKEWRAESAVHDSKGPHGKVRSYYNPKLAEAIEAEAETFPIGSISVKELYNADGKTLVGYALEAKNSDLPHGKGWLWYEGFAPEFHQYYGLGLTTCVSCHKGGKDFVMSSP
jgi:hypothetical protein